MNKLSIINASRNVTQKVFDPTLAIDDIAINDWFAQYTDTQTNTLYDFSIKGLTHSFDLRREEETELVWQYLGLPDNRDTTYVPLLTCPDDLDLTCSVLVTEQSYDKNCVSWQRFGFLFDDLTKQDPNSIKWLSDVPKLIFKRDNFINIFSQLNTEVVKQVQNRGEVINIPFPAKPIKEDWEKIVDSWYDC